MIVAIVGARDRSSIKDKFRSDDIKADRVPESAKELIQGRDRRLLESAVGLLKMKFGGNLTLVSVGCDDGVGYMVKKIANDYRIQFVEVSLHFLGERRQRADYTKFYMARNATVDCLGDVFYILTSDSKQAVIDDLLDRVKEKPVRAPYVVIDESGKIVERNNIPDEDLQWVVLAGDIK